MRYALLLLAALAGCGPMDNNNHGYGYTFDESTASGLRVRYANNDPPRLDIIERFYEEVAACMGLNSELGPLVIIEIGLVAKIGADAQIYYPETIVIDAQVTTFDWGPNARFTPPPYIFKHEMVHYLLDRSGFPQDRNSAHGSPFFDACGH